MISFFKDGLLFIKIEDKFKQIASKTDLSIIVLFKTAVTRAPPSVLDIVNYAISYVLLLNVVLHVYQKLISIK